MSQSIFLSEEHRRELSAAGILPSISEIRGYRSANSKSELKQLGFTRRQQLFPSLLIPIFNLNGKVVSTISYPDSPRKDQNGNRIEYEIPAHDAVTMDISPAARARVLDADTVLFIVEGILDADKIISEDAACIGMIDNPQAPAFGEIWHTIPLKNRQVIIVPSPSNTTHDSSVQSRFTRLGHHLILLGADVKMSRIQSINHQSILNIENCQGASIEEMQKCATVLSTPVYENKATRSSFKTS